MTECQGRSAERMKGRRRRGQKRELARWRGASPSAGVTLPSACSLWGDLMWHCIISPCLFGLARIPTGGAVGMYGGASGAGELAVKWKITVKAVNPVEAHNLAWQRPVPIREGHCCERACCVHAP